MKKEQEEAVIEYITERDNIAEDMGNRPADVACLNGAITALRLAGIDIEYNSRKEKWVIYS